MPIWLEVILTQLEELCREIRREKMDMKNPAGIVSLNEITFAFGSMGYKTGKALVLQQILVTEGAVPEEFRKVVKEKIEKMLEPFSQADFYPALGLVKSVVDYL